MLARYRTGGRVGDGLDQAADPRIGRVESGQVVQHPLVDPHRGRGQALFGLDPDQLELPQRPVGAQRAPMRFGEDGECCAEGEPGAELGNLGVQLRSRGQQDDVAFELTQAEHLCQCLNRRRWVQIGYGRAGACARVAVLRGQEPFQPGEFADQIRLIRLAPQDLGSA